MLCGLLINNLRTRRLPGKALQPGKVTWFSAETLWQIQHRYASVHGTGKIPGRYRLPGARAGTVTPELELGRRGSFLEGHLCSTALPSKAGLDGRLHGGRKPGPSPHIKASASPSHDFFLPG